MKENYLYGEVSSTVNAMLSATAWNLMKMMRKLRAKALNFAHSLLQQVFDYVKMMILIRENIIPKYGIY
jgi:hypothetical protein